MTRVVKFLLFILPCATLVVLFFYCSDDKVIGLADVRKELARSSLVEMNTMLRIAAIPKPDGGGCRSIEAAIQGIASESSTNTFYTGYSPQGSIYVNPDWSIWMHVATNDDLHSNEIAGYVSPAIANASNAPLLYVGVSFNNQMLEISNPPAWPPAIHWLKPNSTNHQLYP